MSLLNPELQRNLWLELTPRRVVMVPVIIGLFFLPSLTLAGDPLASMSRTGIFLFYFLTVLWGTRMAAGAVVSEVRGRTWDNQRLSALSAADLLWGKLIGAPVLTWYGGAIALIPVILNTLFKAGALEAGLDIAYYLTIGLFAQSVSLLSSLLFIRRRASLSWLDTFLFQIAGLVAGSVAASIWTAARYVGELSSLQWYGHSYSSAHFSLVSLFAFMAWALFGAWRLMRRELQMRNSALGFGAFLLFLMVYYAGFADLIENDGWRLGGRLFIASLTAAAATYAMLLLEAKDAVEIRRLFARLKSGRVDQFLAGLPSWMIAYLGAVTAMVLFLVSFDPLSGTDIAGHLKNLPQMPELDAIRDFSFSWRAFLLAFLMFLTRDMGLFLMFNFAPRAKRADFVAILWLVLLYFVLPLLIGGMGQTPLLAAFVAYPTNPVWLGPLLPAAEAALVLAIAWQRLFQVNSKTE